MNAQGIMDYVQALFSFFIAPLFGTILLGMFWKRATSAGGFWGLLVGHGGFHLALHLGEAGPQCAIHRGIFAGRERHGREPLSRALVVGRLRSGDRIVSYATRPRPVEELQNVVYGATKLPKEGPVPLFKNHWFWASVVIVVFFILNLIFF